MAERVTHLCCYREFNNGFVGVKLLQSVKTCDPIVYEELDQFTALGNPYFHDTSSHQLENGHLVWMYVNQDEMESAWNKRSSIKYHDLDNKNQPLFGTLMRYLTSKDLRKDAEGVNKLTETDVKQIENGRTSIASNNGLKTRLSTFLMEYEIYRTEETQMGIHSSNVLNIFGQQMEF